MKLHDIQSGDLSANDSKFAVVAARFNSEIVSNLLSGVITTLSEQGVPDNHINTVFVPGAFELPLVAQQLAASKQYSAVITLGCVIRGDTPHFDFVAGECARGIMQANLATKIPIIFGVLTTDTHEQAQLRSQVNGENKGVDCALCALEMTNVLRNI